jgi:hypothetical protein
MRYLPKISILLIIISTIISCNRGPSKPSDSNDCLKYAEDVLLPSAIGNYWKYSMKVYTSFTDSVTYSIVDTLTVNYEDKNYKVFIAKYDNEGSDPNWLYWNGPDGLYSMGGLTRTDTVIYPVLQFKYPVSQGETWEVPRMVYNLYGKEFYIKDTITYTCIDTNFLYITPLDTFQTYVYMFKIRPAEDVQDKEIYKCYYTPSIGLIAKTIGYEEPHSKIFLYEYCLHLR